MKNSLAAFLGLVAFQAFNFSSIASAQNGKNPVCGTVATSIDPKISALFSDGPKATVFIYAKDEGLNSEIRHLENHYICVQTAVDPDNSNYSAVSKIISVRK